MTEVQHPLNASACRTDAPRGIVKRVEVQVGIDDGLKVEIRNEALTGQELVIVRGAGVLRPGDQVLAVPPVRAD